MENSLKIQLNKILEGITESSPDTDIFAVTGRQISERGNLFLPVLVMKTR